MLVDHLSRLSLLNFCSSESIVRVGIPDIVNRGKLSRSSTSVIPDPGLIAGHSDSP